MLFNCKSNLAPSFLFIRLIMKTQKEVNKAQRQIVVMDSATGKKQAQVLAVDQTIFNGTCSRCSELLTVDEFAKRAKRKRLCSKCYSHIKWEVVKLNKIASRFY